MSAPRIKVWHYKGWFYAEQGPHRVSVKIEGDIVRERGVWFRTQAKALGLLVVAKQAVQQQRRPAPPDSRPQRCHAKPRGKEMVCRWCRLKWDVFALNFPDCKGDG